MYHHSPFAPLPENHWFLRPNLGINICANVNEAALSTLLLQPAIVSQPPTVGSACERWFWWRQMLPTQP